MWIIIFFSLYIALLKKKTSVASLLAAMAIMSAVFSYFVDRTPEIVDIVDLFNMLFTIIILFIFFHAFRDYKIKNIREISNVHVLNYYLFFLAFFSAVAIIINIYIVNASFTYIFGQNVDITSYKNQGEAAHLIRIWVNPWLVSYANIFSPLGYLALSFHFYFLSKSKFLMSCVFLVLSLNIPLNGLHGLSRAASAQYILLYIFFYIYTYQAIDKKIRTKINVVVFIIMTSIIIGFIAITQSRFSESNYYYVESDGFIQNKSLYSIFDYFSQWNENGIVTMREFSADKIRFAKSSIPMLDRIMGNIGLDVVSYKDVRANTLGSYASKFNGLVSTLLYDFGYVLTFVASCIYALFVRLLGPRRGEIQLNNFVLFSVFITVPLMFFTNNFMTYLLLNVAVVYSMLTWLLLKMKFAHKEIPH